MTTIKANKRSESQTDSRPLSIPLNSIDRVYLVPETENLSGTFFPMSILRTVHLKQAVLPEQVLEALLVLDTCFPQYRLGYSLNIEALRWERVEQTNLPAYFSTLIEVHSQEKDLDSFLAHAVSKNSEPLKHPFHICIYKHYLIFKIHHSFGDGLFLTDLVHKFLLALLKPETFNALPEMSADFWLPIWKIVWDETGQGLSILSRAAKKTLSKFLKYQQHTATAPTNTHKREPIVSGSAIGVVTNTFSPQVLEKLNTERKNAADEKISLNTWLQVKIATRLQEMGYIAPPIVYTVPVDIRRYMQNSDKFYPGNISTHVQITVHETDPILASHSLQTEVSKRLQEIEPLAGIPVEWLVNLAPRKLYDRLHRNWMLTALQSDPRFFVFTNIGSFNPVFDDLEDSISSDIFLTVPVMDTPMVIGFNTYRGQGNLCASYDPSVISRADVETLLRFE